MKISHFEHENRHRDWNPARQAIILFDSCSLSIDVSDSTIITCCLAELGSAESL